MAEAYKLERVDTSPSLKDKAYAVIKDAIVSVRLEPGTPLVEYELAQQLGISKTPVRDALQELEREGFVTRVFSKGTYVTEVTMEDMTEIFQLRAVLEGLAARLAVPLMTPEELDQIVANHAAAEAALADGNVSLCSQYGQKLHQAIISKADNQRLTLIIRNLDEHLKRLRVLSDRITGRLFTSMREHLAIVEALDRRDPMAAEQAMRDHLFSVLRDLSAPEESPVEPRGA